MKMLPKFILLLTALLLGGCFPHADSPPAPENHPAPPATRIISALDSTPAVATIFHLEIFVVSVPHGTFSGNEPFWKRIDEQCVDVATHELLYNNGIRVGIAPQSELGSFSKYMNDVSPVQKISINGSEIKNAKIEMKKDLPEQAIFYFDKDNIPIGRTFDECENIMEVSFEPAPRKPGQIRLTLCPMVRATRKRMLFTQLNEGYEMKFINPERYYDLNFRVDIPGDSFLVVSPSPRAQNTMTVGNAFLTKSGAADRLEQILIVIPHPYISEKN